MKEERTSIGWGWLAAAVILAGVLGHKLTDADLFSKICRGGQMVQARRIHIPERTCWPLEGQMAPAIDWGGEILVWMAYRLVGLGGLHLINALTYTAAFVLAGYCARRRGGSEWGVAVSMILAFSVCLNNVNTRPQTIGFLAMSLLILICDRLKGWHLWFSLISLGLIWNNIHPSTALGVVYVASLIVGRWLSRRFGDETNMDTLNRPSIRDLLIGLFLILIILPIHPEGFNLFWYQHRNADISRSLGITEWLPSWKFIRASGPFLIVASFSALLIYIRRNRRLLPYLLPFCVFTLLGLTAVRMIAFWAIMAIPLLTLLLTPYLPVSRLRHCGIRIIAIMVFLLTLFISPWLRSIGESSYSESRVIDPIFPINLIKKLKHDGPRRERRIFNAREYAGAITLWGEPEWRLYIDGRLYRQPQDVLNTYRDISFGKPGTIKRLTEIEADTLILHPKYHYRLIKRLDTIPQWLLIYSDDTCCIYEYRR